MINIEGVSRGMLIEVDSHLGVTSLNSSVVGSGEAFASQPALSLRLCLIEADYIATGRDRINYLLVAGCRCFRAGAWTCTLFLLLCK